MKKKMMTKYDKIIWLCAVLVSLSGCRDMFYREVDFRVEGEQEKLVLSCEYTVGEPFTARIYHSVLADKTITREGDTTEVSDAIVRVRANDGEWHHLTESTLSSTIAFRPLDTVEMQITHPDYPAATVRQILPGNVHGRILSYHFLAEGWIGMSIEFAPYHGNPDDIIGIRILNGTAQMTNKVTPADKQTQELILEYLYTTDATFTQVQNIQSAGYYAGSHNEFLFLPASALQDTLRVTVFADGRQLNGNTKLKRENYVPVTLNYLTLEVRAYTHDSYLYELFRQNITDVTLPPPSGVPVNNGNIVLEALDGIASALGGQEMIPPFTNVEGGFGCFRAYSYTYFIVPPSKAVPCMLSGAR